MECMQDGHWSTELNEVGRVMKSLRMSASSDGIGGNGLMIVPRRNLYTSVSVIPEN